MKTKITTLFGLSLLITALTFSSCSKSSIVDAPGASSSKQSSGSTSTSPSTTLINLNTSQLTGNWHVSYYFDKSVKTTKFAGYTFTFGNTGAVTATKSTTTVSGTWSGSSGGSKFILNFVAPKPFSELNEDWKIISQTTTKLELVHVSGGNGGTDYLTFEQ